MSSVNWKRKQVHLEGPVGGPYDIQLVDNEMKNGSQITVRKEHRMTDPLPIANVITEFLK